MIARRLFLCAIAALGCALSEAASAQSYPAKPIRIIVAFAPGGPADVMARLVGQKLTATLGQNIVIDNRPGAGGTIGARAAAEAEPDGYSLLLGNTSTLIIGPLIYKNVYYDAVKSFAPVALLGTTSNLLIVNPALPAKSVQELIALARAQPGKLNFSSAGIGTPPHLIGEMFKQRLGLEVVHVPYKGGGPSVQAVVAGETQFSFENPASSLALAQAGTVRALATTSEMRNPQTPEVPTMAEAGVKGFDIDSWMGIFAPAKTPPEVVAKLRSEIRAILPSLKEPYEKVGGNLLDIPDAQAAPFIQREYDMWTKVIKDAGIKLD